LIEILQVHSMQVSTGVLCL